MYVIHLLFSSHHRYQTGDNNYNYHSAFFEQHVVIDKKIKNKITESDGSSRTPVAENYTIIVDGKLTGYFLTHFWRSTGFWFVGFVMYACQCHSALSLYIHEGQYFR